jgi:hypothetical protein
MRKFILCAIMCLTSTTMIAQTAAKDSIVYISNGCKENTYHTTMYCTKLMKCRHEHQGALMKECKNSCSHTGHVVATTLEEALKLEKKECYVCCKKIKI